MATSLIPFQFGTFPIRTFSIDGDPWFVAKDVAEALGYKDTVNAVKQHCKGVAKHHPLQTTGGMQEVRIINEPDVLRLIVKSGLPEAERFEKWVFEEVLPAIRKTGSYAVPIAASDLLRQQHALMGGVLDCLDQHRALIDATKAVAESVKDDVAAVKAELDQFKADTFPPAYTTIEAYADRQGLALNRIPDRAARMGRECVAQTELKGMEVKTVVNPRFGRVNSYPTEVVEACFVNNAELIRAALTQLAPAAEAKTTVLARDLQITVRTYLDAEGIKDIPRAIQARGLSVRALHLCKKYGAPYQLGSPYRYPVWVIAEAVKQCRYDLDRAAIVAPPFKD